MRRVLLSVVMALAVVSPAWAASELTGVLILAHGGTDVWDNAVRTAVRNAKLTQPTEVALGMAMHAHEVRAVQEAVERLQRKGVKRIVVIPLLVSSHSEVFRQFQYLFGLRQKAEWPEAGKPLALEVPIVMGQALDDHPLLADILLERARRLSQRPQDETVAIVAHGPNDETDNQLWLADIQRVAQQLKQQGGFREVITRTMRDDAPKAVHDRAKEELRDAIRSAGQHGRVLVVPLLLARGGVEKKIPKLLAGVPHVYKGETLLPHKRIEEWIAREVGRLAGPAAPGTGTSGAAPAAPSVTGRAGSSEGLSPVVK